MGLLTNDLDVRAAFSVYENKGVFALLLGSGLSRAAGIPTGWEITLDLIRRIGLAQGAGEQPDWAHWYREKTGAEPNYSTLLEELALSPIERRSILHSYIEPTEDERREGRKMPTKAHLAIADLVRVGYIRVVVTTNFDRLIENALRERGVEPTVVASSDALIGAEPISHSACYVLKLHGDYKDARILNTDTELRTYSSVYDQLLDRIFDEYGLIVAGWSGEWDHALRSALLRAPNRRYPVYWAARSELRAAAQDLANHRHARIVQIADADSFFWKLQQHIETLSQSQRQNPLSVELLVNSAKRYLAKPEYRIQLEELLAEQSDRLVAQLDSPQFSPQGQHSQQEFRHRIKQYEAATEVLARMVGVLGRWGDNSELRLVLDVIRTLYAHAEKGGGGFTMWLNIRSYPAVLIFYSYGIALTRSQRWRALHELFVAEISRERQESSRLVETIFLWYWNGGNDEYWKQMEELDRHYTPLSDHLCSLMADWGRGFTGLTPDFELLFERFETLGALAHLEGTEQAELEAALADPQQNGCVRMPIGRVGWDSPRRGQLIKEIESKERRSAMLDAGFGRNSNTFLELFATNMVRIVWRLGWR